MKIKRVVIKNFRAIKELAFEPGNLCTLIGENNSGKTTIMRALNLVLGEFYPRERDFDEGDFHDQNTDEPVVIQVYFDQPWEEERAGNKATVHGFELTCKRYKRATREKVAGELGVDFTCIGPQGGAVRNPAIRYRPGDPPVPPLTVTNQMRARVPLLYVDVMREYARHRPSGRYSVLRRLVDHIHASFSTDKNLIQVAQPDGTSVKMARPEAFAHLMQRAYNVLKTDELGELETRLEANALDHLGLEPGKDGVSLGFAAHDPANAYKNLELLIDQLGVTSTAEEVGAGLQSAIVVAIFRTYEEMQKGGAIFAIEEPEAFLHPQKARYFAGVLERLSQQNQVFLTTHSPYFVKLHAPETVAVVRRTAAEGTKVVQASSGVLTPDLKAALKIQTGVNAERGEMLFARKVLFVEGSTERVAMSFVFDALKVDANKENITVVDCGGKTAIPFFIRIAEAFKIPFAVLADLDPGKPPQPTDDLRKVCPADGLFLLDPDFEGACGYVAGDKVVDAHKHFTGLALDDMPEALRNAVERVVAL